jgi:putative hemolysin
MLNAPNGTKSAQDYCYNSNMPEILIEFTIILLLIGLNALFALSEIAVVSARTVRLQQMAENGSRGASVALEMARSPNRFLSTVQVGITLVGIFAGAFGGARMAAELAEWIGVLPVIGVYADTMSLAVIIGGITFLSVVFGELVPKRIALQNAEKFAAMMARPMSFLAWIASPVVRVLSATTSMVLAVLRVKDTVDTSVSEEDIRVMAKESARAGIIEEAERDMLESVFRLNDRQLGAMMTPRMEIVWLDVNAPEEKIRQVLRETGHTRLPVCDADLDHVLGVAHAKDLLTSYVTNDKLDVKEMIREPLFAPESMPALKALEAFKASGLHMALVIDEYGGIEGVVTLIDILEAIVGDIPTPDEIAEPPIVEREDGSWLVEGLLTIPDFQEAFELRALPGEGNYHTLGGFVIYMLGQVPTSGSQFGWGGFRFEVMDMDGKRVDKVLMTAAPGEE